MSLYPLLSSSVYHTLLSSSGHTEKSQCIGNTINSLMHEVSSEGFRLSVTDSICVLVYIYILYAASPGHCMQDSHYVFGPRVTIKSSLSTSFSIAWPSVSETRVIQGRTQ